MARAGLTPTRVIAEGASVADEVGLERLTLAAVANRLGVTLPSLYKHVNGLEALRRELALLGIRELTGQLSAAAVGRAGRDALQGVAGAYRAYAHRRPGVVAASVMAPRPDDAEHLAAGEQIVGVLVASLAGYRLTDPDLIDAIRSLRVVLHGFTSLEDAGGFGLPQSVDETFERLIDALDTTFLEWGAGGAGPVTTASIAALKPPA
jgi:AcrR family transcriptional regulator